MQTAGWCTFVYRFILILKQAILSKLLLNWRYMAWMANRFYVVSLTALNVLFSCIFELCTYAEMIHCTYKCGYSERLATEFSFNWHKVAFCSITGSINLLSQIYCSKRTIFYALSMYQLKLDSFKIKLW